MKQFSIFIERVSQYVTSFPKVTIAICLAITAMFAAQLPKLTIDAIAGWCQHSTGHGKIPSCGNAIRIVTGISSPKGVVDFGSSSRREEGA